MGNRFSRRFIRDYRAALDARRSRRDPDALEEVRPLVRRYILNSKPTTATRRVAHVFTTGARSVASVGYCRSRRATAKTLLAAIMQALHEHEDGLKPFKTMCACWSIEPGLRVIYGYHRFSFALLCECLSLFDACTIEGRRLKGRLNILMLALVVLEYCEHGLLTDKRSLIHGDLAYSEALAHSATRLINGLSQLLGDMAAQRDNPLSRDDDLEPITLNFVTRAQNVMAHLQQHQESMIDAAVTELVEQAQSGAFPVFQRAAGMN